MNSDPIIASTVLFMFFISGVEKTINFPKTVMSFQKRVFRKLNLNLTLGLARLAIALVILLEIMGPLMVVRTTVNRRGKDLAIRSLQLLALFTVAATLLYHFPATGKQWYPFISNVTTLGALLLLHRYLQRNY